MLSGYLGSPAIVGVVADFVTRAMKRNPTLIYCCDPVMGDADCGLFAAPGLPEMFRDTLCPLANILMPNQFELGWLAHTEIRTLDDLTAAARTLSQARSATVVVTGAMLSDAADNVVTTVAVEGASVWSVTTPKLPIALSGTGDLFAALFVASLIRGSTTPYALIEAVSATFAVIEDTAAAGSLEMGIVASAARLADPPRTFEAVAYLAGPC